MAKVKDYFSHDYHARSDLRGILKDWGLAGIGFYWCFVEILHENGGVVKEADLESIAFELRADPELCQGVVRNYDLFTVKGGKVSSDRVRRNLKKRSEISEARKKAADARWGDTEGGKTPSDEENGEAAQKPVPADGMPACGTGGFLGADEKQSHKESMDWYKNWFAEKFDAFEEKACKNGYTSEFDEHPVWGVRGIFENIVEAVAPYPITKIGRRNIKTLDFISTIKWFVYTDTTLEALAQVIREVNEKADNGEIKNKQNYLISALYQAAKMHGG